jgi:hypothetical protein
MIAAFVTAVGYAYVVGSHIGCAPWLPAIQRVASLALIAWMTVVALTAPAHRR